MNQSLTNWLIEHNFIKSEAEIFISILILFIMLIIYFLTYAFNKIKIASINNLPNNIKLEENEKILHVISKDKPGCITFFGLSTCFLFTFTSFFMDTTSFIFSGIIFTLITSNYIDLFFSKLIVTNKKILFNNLFSFFQVKNVPFNKVKIITVTSYRGIMTLRISTQKGLPIIFTHVADAYNIKAKIDTLIFTEEELKEQSIQEEKQNGKDIVLLTGLFLLAPIILLIISLLTQTH